MNYTITREQQRELRDLDYMGHDKILCIKKVREFSGAGLKEAKEFVESGMSLPCTIFENTWTVDSDGNASFTELMGRLFELTAEIAEIHNILEEKARQEE